MKPTILWLISNNNNNTNKCVDVINFLQQSVLTAWTKILLVLHHREHNTTAGVAAVKQHTLRRSTVPGCNYGRTTPTTWWTP